jgi:hypothetical protein
MYIIFLSKSSDKYLSGLYGVALRIRLPDHLKYILFIQTTYIFMCKHTLKIHVRYLENKEIYWIFKTWCIICFIFHSMPFIA